jgi:hypothetical protein
MTLYESSARGLVFRQSSSSSFNGIAARAVMGTCDLFGRVQVENDAGDLSKEEPSDVGDEQHRMAIRTYRP